MGNLGKQNPRGGKFEWGVQMASVLLLSGIQVKDLPPMNFAVARTENGDQMLQRDEKLARGFTVIEIGVALLIIGVIAVFAVPRISNAMREYRLNNAMRQITDLMQQAKTQAMSNNTRATLRVDTANSRAGLVVYDSNGAEIRTDYIPLPQSIRFSQPASMSAPMTGAPTSGVASFPAQEASTAVFQQDFTSRGFPSVSAAGAINVIYIGNNLTYRAITLSSVGGIRTWVWRNSAWVNTRQQ